MACLKVKVYLDKFMICVRSDGFAIAQGHIWSRLAFLKYFNYWKIAGLRPLLETFVARYSIQIIWILQAYGLQFSGELLEILKLVLYIFDYKGAELVGHDLF